MKYYFPRLFSELKYTFFQEVTECEFFDTTIRMQLLNMLIIYSVNSIVSNLQISLCARIQKKTVLNWPPSKMTRSCHPQNGIVPNSGEFWGDKFWTLQFIKDASPLLRHFRGWPVQVLFPWILAQKTQTIPNGTPSIYKIHPFSKIAENHEPVSN